MLDFADTRYRNDKIYCKQKMLLETKISRQHYSNLKQNLTINPRFFSNLQNISRVHYETMTG